MARSTRHSGSKRPGALSGAGRWAAALITTGAALAALLVNARNLGLDAWLGAAGLGFADRAARRVTVLPRGDTLYAVGDSTALAATVTDERGAVLVGASLVWRSDDTSIAAVDSSGVVVARGAGVTRVTVSVRDLVAGARIVVRQVPAGVRIVGDTLVGLLEGDTVALAGHAVDARQHRVRDARLAWHSSDTAVAVVDSLGAVSARAPGRARISATMGEYRADVAVTVALAPAALEVVAGGDQRAPAGRLVAQPVVLRVLSVGGQPVPDLPVQLRATDEGTAPDTATTDRAGRVRVAWTLGPRPGPQRLVASVAALDSPLVVLAEADPVPANTRVEVDSALPHAAAGEALPAPVTVRVTDSLGAALAGVPVAWTPLDGGSAEALAPRTDSLGEARARWTLGPKAGGQRLRVLVGNPRTVPPATFRTTAVAGAPAAMALAGGQAQRGVVGEPLAQAVGVTVRDAHGNPVPGATLTAQPTSGSVPDTALVTDSAGRAALRWSLGPRAGAQRLVVRAEGVDSTLTVTARARPGPAVNVAFRDPPARATGGTPIRLVATARDAYDNAVSGVPVAFAASAGALSAIRVMSDTSGAAATRWTPGAVPGEQTLTATLRGTSAKATHVVRVAAPPGR